MKEAYIRWERMANGKVLYQLNAPDLDGPKRSWLWQAERDLKKWLRSQDGTRIVETGRVWVHPEGTLLLKEDA